SGSYRGPPPALPRRPGHDRQRSRPDGRLRSGPDVNCAAMEITYFGLNAIRVRGRDATLLIDPYDPKLGLAPVRLTVQIVAFTHDDPTHFSTQGLSGDYHVVNGAGEYEIKGIFVRGIQTYHDAQHGAK